MSSERENSPDMNKANRKRSEMHTSAQSLVFCLSLLSPTCAAASRSGGRGRTGEENNVASVTFRVVKSYQEIQ
jgi:hypothetical protein